MRTIQEILNRNNEVTEPRLPSYDELVNGAIRAKYSLSAEMSILRQRDVKPVEFELYNSYCERCKQEARDIIAKRSEL